MSDLSLVTYGPTAKAATDILVIITQLSFLVAYNMYFGSQSQTIICNATKFCNMNPNVTYTIMFNVVLLPVVLQNKMSSIANFSFFALFCTIISVIMTTVSEIRILHNPQIIPKETVGEPLFINTQNLVLFMSTFMCIFEGNTCILSLYSETDQPKNFLSINIVSQYLLIAMFFVSSLLGYLTFGKSLRSVVLLNLPSNDPLSLVTQGFYLVTIMGSFVILIQPLFDVIERYPWYQDLKLDSGGHLKFLIGRISIVAFTIYVSNCLPNINSLL